MPVKLATHADEEGTFHVVCTFSDEDSASVIPLTLVWTLCDLDGNVINGRTAVNVAVPATANTIGGAFLASTNNKGGSTGTLLCVVTFTAGDKAATAGDTLTVTYSFSAADA